jgi:glycosyltransferase involved in cell wall biosynthesis
MSDPLVSICVPMYNAEKTIVKTLESIVNQTYKNLEIIVVDNASTDASLSFVAMGFSDPRIRIIRYNEHLPHGELNWNRCFSYATGEYMAIFHADDIYLPNMVSRQVETFQKHPGIGGVFTQGNIIDENDKIIGEFRLPQEIASDTPYTYQEILEPILKYADFLPTPSAMIRRDLYTECSPFDIDTFGSASDLHLYLCVAERAPLVVLDEKLMNYRVTSTQGSNRMNRLRMHESPFFGVLDHHLKKFNNIKAVSDDAICSYEMSRFGDRMLCAKNAFYKRDWGSFGQLMNEADWGKFCIMSVRHPNLLYEKFRMFRYFGVFKA